MDSASLVFAHLTHLPLMRTSLHLQCFALPKLLLHYHNAATKNLVQFDGPMKLSTVKLYEKRLEAGYDIESDGSSSIFGHALLKKNSLESFIATFR